MLMFLFIFLFSSCQATLFKFPEEGSQVTDALQGGYFHYAQPMFASQSKTSNAFIAFNLELKRIAYDFKSALPASTAEIIVIESDSSHDIGYHDASSSFICCTKKRMDDGIPGCTSPGSLIIGENVHSIWRKNVQLPENTETVSFHDIYEIKRSSFHQVIISRCVSSNDKLVLSGEFEFKNAYGYLPGQLYAYLPFYTAMSFAYFIASVGWIAFNVKNANELIPIHHVITASLLLALVSMVSWGFHYEVYNMFGTEQDIWKYIAILSGALRQTSVHVLVLCISSGLGIVNLEFGTEKLQLAVLSFLFFVSKLVFEITQDASKTPFNPTCLIAAGFFFMVEAVVYWKVYEFTAKLLERLEERKQTSKFGLYNRIVSLFIVAMLGVSLILLERAYLMHYGLIQAKWKLFWLVDSGLFEMLSFVVSVGIMTIFMPSSRSKMMIGADQLPIEEEYGLEMQGTEEYEEEPLHGENAVEAN